MKGIPFPLIPNDCPIGRWFWVRVHISNRIVENRLESVLLCVYSHESLALRLSLKSQRILCPKFHSILEAIRSALNSLAYILFGWVVDRKSFWSRIEWLLWKLVSTYCQLHFNRSATACDGKCLHSIPVYHWISTQY